MSSYTVRAVILSLLIGLASTPLHAQPRPEPAPDAPSYSTQWHNVARATAEEKKQAVRELVESGTEYANAVTSRTLPESAQENRNEAATNRSSANSTKRTPEDLPAKPLKDAKLKACQNREQAIQNLMVRLSDRGADQLELFSTIANQTEQFYERNNYQSDQYAALIEQVKTRRILASDAVTATQEASYQFECDASNPKGIATIFNERLRLQTTMLNEYKTAVKNLIVGVKQAGPASDTPEQGGVE